MGISLSSVAIPLPRAPAKAEHMTRSAVDGATIIALFDVRNHRVTMAWRSGGGVPQKWVSPRSETMILVGFTPDHKSVK